MYNENKEECSYVVRRYDLIKGKVYRYQVKHYELGPDMD